MPERLATPDEPLALTVHAMPAPKGVLGQGAQRTRSGRWKMLLVALVCAAPVVASYFTYYVVRPEARRSFGTLVEPQRPIPAAHSTDLNGQPFPLQSLAGQWLLISVSDGVCEERCERNLYLQRQLREGLGKDKDRLDWVWLVSDQARVPEALRPALSKATVVRVPQAELVAWLSPGQGQRLGDHLYVVDPMGHLMMRFPANLELADAGRAKRDLERLLRASASWDQAGRTP